MKFTPEQPYPPDTEAGWFESLAGLARFLRSPNGCPWDRAHSSNDFAGFALDEARELSDALASGDDRHAEEEFGDCLFTLFACMAAAEAEGRFTLASALQHAYEKMMRRHAHVFAAERAQTPEEAMNAWAIEKAREKKATCRDKQP